MSDIKQRIRGFYDELWNRANYRYVDEVCSPNYVGHIATLGDIDKEGLKQMVRGFRDAFPDLKFRVDEILIAGNEVVVRWTAQGTHKGKFMGIAPTGRFGETMGADIIRLEGDRTKEHWGYWDGVKILQTIGALPAYKPSGATVETEHAPMH